MSPSATGGPPHIRTASFNGGGPVSTSNGVKTGGVEGGMSMKNIWLHHDDLVAATPDLDIHSPIEKILREGDRLAKAADTSLDFRRPDIALQEYVKASIIAAEIIPRHKDFPALQSDRKDLHRVYMGLTKRIKGQDEKFMNVKKIVKENNALHGTQPKAAVNAIHEVSSNILENGGSRTLPSEGNANQPPRKNPPPIQPKPDALHGKAIPHAGIHTTNSSQVDLATRFARLRSPETISQVQDPRIRTQPIHIPEISNSNTGPISPRIGSTINKPSGPREMPSVPTTVPHPAKISLDVNLPGLPRTPDAIYSPARGAENAATVNLPSSIVRNNSYLGNGRKNSAPPISTIRPTPSLVDNKTDYFLDAQKTDSHPHARRSFNEQQVVLPKKTTLTADELMNYLRRGSHAIKILLVDLRSREDFDNGHIMSQFIICVEPITLRHGISGEELADSMVIAPDVEQKTFELRQTFDLVVFYDQSSNSTNPSTPTEASKKLHDFASAVYEYSYEKHLKQPPVLLVGGLDAWIDLLGPSSLEMSSTGKTLRSTVPNGVKKARPLDSISKPRDSQAAFLARKRTYQSRPLSKEEENMWESTLREEKDKASTHATEGPAPDEIVYARTTEDFIRRYPELPSIQESMTAPVMKSSVHPLEAELSKTIARPPARPPPALPRQRSSGISERDTIVPYASQTTTISTLRQPRGLTGLSNRGTLCYMNAVVQAFSHTPFVREMFENSPPPVPRKGNESTNPPQLLFKCLQNLIGHLRCGQWDYVNPKTFIDYVFAVHSKSIPKNDAFGGHRQHDAQEFLSFLIVNLEDELNLARDLNEPSAFPVDILRDMTLVDKTLAEAATRWWNFRMKPYQKSYITDHMRGLYCQVVTCSHCHKETRNFMSFTMLVLTLPENHSGTITLKRVIELLYGPNSVVMDMEARECDFCSIPIPNPKPKEFKKTRHLAKSTSYIVYWPDTLVIMLSRHQVIRVTKDSQPKEIKIMNPVTFPEQIDFSGCKIKESPPSSVDRHTSCDPVYDVYACVMHQGTAVSSGHYYTIARSPDMQRGIGGAGDWHNFNDTSVKSTTFDQIQSQAQNDRTIVPYIIFLKKVKK